MRPLIIVEPVVRPALRCRRLAALGLLLAGAAVAGSRAGAVEPRPALALLGAGLGCAVAALAAALAAGAAIWRTGHRGVGPTFGGTVLACALLAYPGWLAARAAAWPAPEDFSTDRSDPVAFAPSPKALALRSGVVHGMPDAAALARQEAAAPDLQPLLLDLSAADAFALAVKLAAARRWTVVDTRPPAGKSPSGQFDAVARSAIMGFPVDVAVRVAALGPDRCKVDLRSATRFDGFDDGAEIRRIEAFLSDLEDAADDQ